jgi:hypothetical protein
MSELLWTYDEFLCFLLIYVSYADIDFGNGEKEAILSQFDNSLYEKQNAIFENLNDYQALELIMKYKPKYFSTLDEKASLLKRVKHQLLSDGVYTNLEKEVYMFLEKLL